MIVQPAEGGGESLVIHQLEHTRMAGAFAKIWGNDQFAPLSPRELVEYVVAHHDQGWDTVDAKVLRDPATGLPYNLVKTPIRELMLTGAGGPDFNERRHPYCGLIASMHVYGLYTGRYGLSDKIFVDMVPAEYKATVKDFLDGELARQERLKRTLSTHPDHAAWVEERALFHVYKQLQFFDTLALYFNCAPDAARGRSSFPNVPRAVGHDVTVTVSRVERGVYAFDPFPFRESGVTVTCAGKRLGPQPEGTDMVQALAAAPEETETLTLVRAS